MELPSDPGNSTYRVNRKASLHGDSRRPNYTTLGKDGPGHPISGPVQFIVCELIVSTLDGKAYRILPNLLFEPLRDGLLNLFLPEFDEVSRRMKTPVPNSLLLWCEVS